MEKYFELTDKQRERFEMLPSIYEEWNAKINVISRKDIDEIRVRHILHSLAIAKVHEFKKGADVLDIGTGGGFPGIPLAILYPDVNFLLVDSIGKKIKVVEGVVEALGLENVRFENCRAENVKEKFDFVVSRAVTQMKDFVPWCKGKFKKECVHERKNGILYLKGGDLMEELVGFEAEVFEISDFFEEEFFETKKVVYLRG